MLLFVCVYFSNGTGEEVNLHSSSAHLHRTHRPPPPQVVRELQKNWPKCSDAYGAIRKHPVQ